MKRSTKPISSPGRTEKFPPPLMRFLRSNVGSRSRGRIRASPMMFMRKNKNNVVIETTQEPGSPKVTCIGQVRVRRGGNKGRTRTQRSRSSSTRKKQQPDRNHISRPCCWCNRCRVKVLHKPKWFISILKKWTFCFQCRKKNDSTSTSRVESTRRVETRVSNTSSTTEEGLVGSVPNPPKDAFILTRCRSAPYRSSSLASRFWGSPLNHTSSDDTTKSQSPKNIENGDFDTSKSRSPQNIIRELENEKPVLENPNDDLESSEVMQSSIKEEDSTREVYVHPLLLTRCKSEPARTGERLNPTRFNELDSQS